MKKFGLSLFVFCSMWMSASFIISCGANCPTTGYPNYSNPSCPNYIGSAYGQCINPQNGQQYTPPAGQPCPYTQNTGGGQLQPNGQCYSPSRPAGQQYYMPVNGVC